MVTSFDDLSDLSLIEIFSYLSCVDALWAFSKLNIRLTTLLFERGFHCYVDLSSTRYYQFQKLLSIFQLNEIRSLVIDCYASPLQLKKWPHLPRLEILRLKGIYDYINICNFIRQHASTLIHLVVESSAYDRRAGLTNQVPLQWNVEKLMKKICHLPMLHSLDLGMKSSFFLHLWLLKRIEAPLTYLRVTTSTIITINQLMSSQPLRHTLKQFHVKLSNKSDASYLHIPCTQDLPRMEALHTFTFVKSFQWHFKEEWTFLNIFTSSDIMPILRRINFSIVIDKDDLYQMNHSSLFTDYRQVDVHYAFVVNDTESHSELLKYVPSGCQSHPRQIASASFISKCCHNDQPLTTSDQQYWRKPNNRQHLFYNSTWIFNEFFELCVGDSCINEAQTLVSSFAKTIGSSRLVKLDIADNIPTPAVLLSNIMSSSQIVELHLLRCDRQISINFPLVTHLTLIDSLDALNTHLLPMNIRSIRIILYHQDLCANNDWIALRILRTLPRLNSLRILLYNMVNTLDDTSCEIIAQTALVVADFGLSFRYYYTKYTDNQNYDKNLIYTEHSLFIERLRNRIITLSSSEELNIVVDEDGCGIFIWF